MEAHEIVPAENETAVVTCQWMPDQGVSLKPKPLPANLFIAVAPGRVLDDREAARRLWLRQKLQHA